MSSFFISLSYAIMFKINFNNGDFSMFKKIALTTLCMSTLLLAESGVGLNINQKDLEIDGVLDSRNLEALQTSSTIYQADVNFLYDDENAKMVGAGLVATNKVEALEGVEVSLGAKFIWAEIGDNGSTNYNFAAAPLMAKVRYTLPPLMYNIPPVSFEGRYLYAPKVLSFGSSSEYNEFRVTGEVEVIENVGIYAGYRNIHTRDSDILDSLFNTGFYAGLKFTY